MELKIKRKTFTDTYTIGNLYVNGKFLCNTLEQCDRGLTQNMALEEIQEKKVYGNTAIPKGRYDIDMNTISSKFKVKNWAKPFGGKVPRLVNVQGFENVLFLGSSEKNADGCITICKNIHRGVCSYSTTLFMSFMAKYLLSAKINGEKIQITII